MELTLGVIGSDDGTHRSQTRTQHAVSHPTLPHLHPHYARPAQPKTGFAYGNQRQLLTEQILPIPHFSQLTNNAYEKFWQGPTQTPPRPPMAQVSWYFTSSATRKESLNPREHPADKLS